MGTTISNTNYADAKIPRSALRFSLAETEAKDQQKKKKSSKLQTLKKKLARARRHSRSYDYSKLIREYTSNWTIDELNNLVEDYETNLLLKELTTLANAARPPAPSLKQDLADLYENQICTDLNLIYQNVCFPVHRAVLSVRCGYFRDLLRGHPDYQATVQVEIKTRGVTVQLFSAVLRYLYTGEFVKLEPKSENLNVLVNLCEEFGTPNMLEHDLQYLLETSEFHDTVLVFSSEEEQIEVKHKVELPCHRALLAARSPFFRSLLLRRSRLDYRTPTTIVLDEGVIPRQYARVLLHGIYLDNVDLSCIVRSSSSTSSLCEVQAMVAGKGQLTHAEEAMEIFQIGQFVEFATLSQGCEDIITESISVETLNAILAWASEAHGSPWVHRQVLHFLREEFLQIAHSPILPELSKRYIIEAIQSDFLQAGEADILTAVIKWGEHELTRRMEEREPNLLTHTAHSVSKKGVKKRDLNDVELRDILSELLPYIRTDHVIPPNHEMLSSCIKRGLISTPPSHMMGDEGSIKRHHAWIRGKNTSMYTRPRFFQPYYDECKALLEEQLCQGSYSGVESSRPAPSSQISSIPDTLYMINDPPSYLSPSASPAYQHQQYSQHQHQHPHHSAATCSPATVDVIAGTLIVPDHESLMQLLRRENELIRAAANFKAYTSPYADRASIRHQIQLRAIRELGLPDSTVQVFQTGQLFHDVVPRHHLHRNDVTAAVNAARQQQQRQRDVVRQPQQQQQRQTSREPRPCDSVPVRASILRMGVKVRNYDVPIARTLDVGDVRDAGRFDDVRHHPRHLSSAYTQTNSQYYGQTGPNAQVERFYAPLSSRAGESSRFRRDAANVALEASVCGDGGGLSEFMPDIAIAAPSFGGTESAARMSQLNLQDTEIELDLGDGASHHTSAYI